MLRSSQHPVFLAFPTQLPLLLLAFIVSHRLVAAADALSSMFDNVLLLLCFICA
jgi:hypothetical protein